MSIGILFPHNINGDFEKMYGKEFYNLTSSNPKKVIFAQVSSMAVKRSFLNKGRITSKPQKTKNKCYTKRKLNHVKKLQNIRIGNFSVSSDTNIYF